MTNFPGIKSSLRVPTADTETISVMPNSFKAAIFALKLIFEGFIK